MRPDQIAKVAAAKEVRLLLVRAPAGYGKTTLVAAAADELGWDCVWYRLDLFDADPPTFLRSLGRAVQQRIADCDTSLPDEDAEREQDSRTRELMSMFVRDLERPAGKDLYIVLDDYDSLESVGPFEKMLASLLQFLPRFVHLIVISRRRPTFATAKLALDGGLIEVTHRDLCLDDSQIAAVVERQSGASQSREEVERLCNLTQGWAAGVVLGTNAAHRVEAGTMDDALMVRNLERAAFSYFSEQVYTRLTNDVREFLYATCSLESMTVSLVEAVSASHATEALLEQLESDGVFTFFDSLDGVYRYHDLFRRFVVSRLAREKGRDAYRAVQRRSADALTAHGTFAFALDLYLTLGEPHVPLKALRQHGNTLLTDCSDALLERWINALRSDAGENSGWVALLEGHRHHRQGDLKPAREQLESALEILNGNESGTFLAHGELRLHCYATGADDEAIDHARRALDASSGQRERAECLASLAQLLSATSRWHELEETLTAFKACGTVPAMLTAQMASLEAHRAYIGGDVRRAITAAESALPRMRRHAPKHQSVSLLNALANFSFFLSHYETASRRLSEAIEEWDTDLFASLGAEIRVTEAAQLAQAGRHDACHSVLDELLEDPCLRTDAALLFEIHALRGTVLRRAGELDRAARTYGRALRLLQPGNPLYDRLNVQLDLAYTENLLGRNPEASLQLNHLMVEAAEAQLFFQQEKARFYSGVLSVRQSVDLASELGLASEQLVRMGHVDFIGQELVARPEAAQALMGSGLDKGLLHELLRVIAAQVGGASLLSSLATASDHAGLLVIDSAGLYFSGEERAQILRELRRHPSKCVRDRARHKLRQATDAERLFPELTSREEEILALIAAGHPNQDIAERLLLSPATVKTYVHRVLAKSGARSRIAAAVLYQHRTGVIGTEAPRSDA